jgi:hypothetical protein
MDWEKLLNENRKMTIRYTPVNGTTRFYITDKKTLIEAFKEFEDKLVIIFSSSPYNERKGGFLIDDKNVACSVSYRSGRDEMMGQVNSVFLSIYATTVFPTEENKKIFTDVFLLKIKDFIKESIQENILVRDHKLLIGYDKNGEFKLLKEQH